MAKRTHSNTISKRVKRNVSKNLAEDVQQWLGAGEEARVDTKNVNVAASLGDNSGPSCSATSSLEVDYHEENYHEFNINEELDKSDSGPNPNEALDQQDLKQGDSNFNEAVEECVWNLTFLEGECELNENINDQNHITATAEGAQKAGYFISLHYDCEMCINCRCGVCVDCIHIDGEACRHCHYCLSGNDSDAESVSSNVSDLDENDSFSVEPTSDLSESEKKNFSITNQFREIALEQDASHALVGKLLSFFRANNFGDFPKCAKTFLKTPTVTKVRSVPPGEYWHRGLKSELMNYARKNNCNKIKVSVSVDGVPMVASTGAEFYPICCSFNDSKDVVLAGVWYGEGKPTNSDDFMKDFVEEMNDLVENGIDSESGHICIETHLFICDAVAKSWLLNVKGHSGYFGCTKCTIEGVRYGGRMAFLQLNCPRRTDESFTLQLQEDYHHSSTILTSLIGFLPVTNVVLDYMHLALLGTMRKLVFMLLAGPKCVRQPNAVICNMSSILESLAAWVPMEFARKCRSLKYVKRYKATEWRLLLFYVGAVLFQSTLPKALYEHFLVFCVSMTILSSDEYLNTHIAYARDLLKYFIRTFGVLYGKKYTSHNIHNLLHLVDDCEVHGVVDNFSAFKFENFYQKLKSMIRKGEKPLQQLCRRYEEQKLKSSKPTKPLDNFGGLHTNGPLPTWCVSPQYSYMQTSFGRNKLSLSQANNCCRLLDGTIVVIENFSTLAESKDKVIVGRKFLHTESLFTFPCESSTFGILLASSLSGLSTWPVSDIRSKCFRMPCKQGYAILPLLHSDFQN